jgi:hypothetical protein
MLGPQVEMLLHHLDFRRRGEEEIAVLLPAYIQVAARCAQLGSKIIDHVERVLGKQNVLRLRKKLPHAATSF